MGPLSDPFFMNRRANYPTFHDKKTILGDTHQTHEQKHESKGDSHAQFSNHYIILRII